MTLSWLALRLQSFVDIYPQFEAPVGQLATWLARGEEDAADEDAADEDAADEESA